MDAAIWSRRLRRCFLFVRGALLRDPPRPEPPPPRDPPVRDAGGRLPGGRPPPPLCGTPERDAVVRARPPAAGLRAPPAPPTPPVPRPPPPVLLVRAGGGRRTEPARGATGEVSSWDGTQQFPSLTVSATSRCGDGGRPLSQRGVFRYRSGGGRAAARPVPEL